MKADNSDQHGRGFAWTPSFVPASGNTARLALTIMNTSVHQLHPVGAGLTLTQFNGVPHLARRDRQHAQTFI